jgi:glutathione synthase/RimK-type ligase-like ATP-grasp enzyme
MHIVDGDQIGGRPSLSWSPGAGRAIVVSNEGCEVSLADVDLVWWRRANATQEISQRVQDLHQRDLINNDCRGTLSGMLASNFHGEWVSTPAATTRASDKLYQLTVASSEGLAVPATLVSQSRDEVLAFAERVGRIIVKPVVGAAGPLMFTQFGDSLAEMTPEAFATAPAMYQEFIPGTRHIRLNCFGDAMYATAIDTDELDWRPNLDVPMSSWHVPEPLRAKISRTLERLELRMGIVDLKLTPSGEAVWLEVNPQGQFLFLEGLTGEPLTKHFAGFLTAEAVARA